MLVDCRKCPSLLHQQEVSGQQSPMQEQHKESVPQSHDQNQHSQGCTRHLKVSSSGSQDLTRHHSCQRPKSQDLTRHHSCQQMDLSLISHCLMLPKMDRKYPSRLLWEADQFGQGLFLPTWKIMSQTFMHRGYTVCFLSYGLSATLKLVSLSSSSSREGGKCCVQHVTESSWSACTCMSHMLRQRVNKEKKHQLKLLCRTEFFNVQSV